EVRVTVIAAGFDGGQPPKRQPGIQRQPAMNRQQPPAPQPRPAERVPVEPVAKPSPVVDVTPRPAPVVSRDTDDELDVPDFLK
ncbi:MAG TPA: cell division protein FtsZ, partial [Propionibacteriaceae bacterium]|nr:cell division protein FtsZ [Propionibacteriaceae bacterium]